MRKTLILMILGVLFFIKIDAQKDSVKIKSDTLQNSKDLLASISADTAKDSTALLPKKMPFTQRIFWGQNGLMRNFDAFKLSPEERDKELKIRRAMLSTHQILGFATLAGMVGQGFVGAKLYNNPTNRSVKDTHEMLAGVVNGLYFSTAALALFAPPKMIDDKKGYSSIKVHKWLAVVHLSSMIATNILASQLQHNPSLKPYHRAAAFTAFGSLAAAMIIIKF